MSQILNILSCILTLFIFRLPPVSLDWTTVQRYRPKFATRLSNPLIADDGKIYICLEKNLLVFKNNGSISATMPLKYTCNADILPVLGAARKLYLVAENRVLKIDTWKTRTPAYASEVFLGPETGERMDKIIGLTVSICSTVVVINIYKRGLFAYKYDGKLKWSIAPSISRKGYRQGCVKNVSGCYFLATPVIDYCDATFYVRNNIGELYAMTITRPRFKWIQDFSSLDKNFTITVGNNGRVYVTVPAKAVILALDVATGTVLWQQNIGPLSSADSAPVADANGWISIGSLDGYLYSISPFGVVNTYPRKNTNIFSGGNAFFHPKNKSLIKDDLDSVIQVNPVLDCSGYAVYIAQTKMDGKFTRDYSEHTTVSALKPIKTVFTLLVPATGSVHWSESYPGSLSSSFNESDLRHYVMDESVLLVFLSISSTGNPLTCFSSRQKIASSCSMTDIKKVRMYTGNEKEIKKFLLFETILLIVLSVLVRFCCVFWNKRKLQNKDLGKFLEKRASLRLQKKQFDRTISELEKKTAEGSSTNEMLEELGGLVKEREDVKRKLSTTYSLGRDGIGPESESLIPVSDKKSKSSSYRSGKKEGVTILHTISDTSSEDDSSYEEVEEIDEKGKGIMEEAENSSDDEESVEEQEVLETLDDEDDHDQSVGSNLRKRSLPLTKNVESNE